MGPQRSLFLSAVFLSLVQACVRTPTDTACQFDEEGLLYLVKVGKHYCENCQNYMFTEMLSAMGQDFKETKEACQEAFKLKQVNRLAALKDKAEEGVVKLRRNRDRFEMFDENLKIAAAPASPTSGGRNHKRRRL